MIQKWADLLPPAHGAGVDVLGWPAKRPLQWQGVCCTARASRFHQRPGTRTSCFRFEGAIEHDWRSGSRPGGRSSMGGYLPLRSWISQAGPTWEQQNHLRPASIIAQPDHGPSRRGPGLQPLPAGSIAARALSVQRISSTSRIRCSRNKTAGGACRDLFNGLAGAKRPLTPANALEMRATNRGRCPEDGGNWTPKIRVVAECGYPRVRTIAPGTDRTIVQELKLAQAAALVTQITRVVQASGRR